METTQSTAPAPASWAPEVQTDSTGKWYGNALRFATESEAYASVGGRHA